MATAFGAKAVGSVAAELAEVQQRTGPTAGQRGNAGVGDALRTAGRATGAGSDVHTCAIEHFVDLGDQAFRLERLAEIIADARLHCLDDKVALAAAGDHDKRHGGMLRMRAQPEQKLLAAHFRHFPIARNQVEALGFQQHLGAHRSAPAYSANLAAGIGVAQLFFHHVADKRGVVDDEKFERLHRSRRLSRGEWRQLSRGAGPREDADRLLTRTDRVGSAG